MRRDSEDRRIESHDRRYSKRNRSPRRSEGPDAATGRRADSERISLDSGDTSAGDFEHANARGLGNANANARSEFNSNRRGDDLRGLSDRGGGIDLAFSEPDVRG